MKIKLSDCIDSVFLLIIGILFLVFPTQMINWIGLIVGIYFIGKALIGFLFPLIFPLSRISAGINLCIGILCLVLWGLFLKFIMILMSIILLGEGLTSLTKTPLDLKNKKTYLPNILAILETLFGVTIFVTAIINVENVLGILSGITLIILAVVTFINSEYGKNNDSINDNNNDKIKFKSDVIDAEIVSEKHTHQD